MTTLRSTIFDGRLQPVTNLSINPRFIKTVSGTTIVRRNLATHGRAVTGYPSNTIGWATRGNTANITLSMETGAGPLPGLNTFARNTYTGNKAVNDSGFDNSRYTAPFPVVVGRTYTFSSYLRASRSGASLRITVGHMSAASTNVSTSSGAITPSVAGVWHRLSFTFVATQPWVQLVSSPTGSGSAFAEWVAGDTLDGTGAMLEERPALLPYFDGSSPADDTGMTCSWEGTVNGSSSVQRSFVIEVKRNYVRDPALLAGAHSISSNGTGSITATPTTTNVRDTATGYTLKKVDATYYGFLRAPSIEATSGSATVFPNGVQVWFGFWAYTATPTVITVVRRGTAGYVGPTFSLTTGWNFVTTSWTANGTSSVAFDVGWEAANGTVGAEVTISGLRMYTHSTALTGAAGEYFDGYTTPEANLTPSWTGTPYQSASVLYSIRPNNVDYTNGANATSYPARWVEPDGSTYLRFQNYGTPGSWRVLLLVPGTFSNYKAGEDVTLLIRHRRSSSVQESTQIMVATGGATSYSGWYTLPVATEWTWTRVVIRLTGTPSSSAGVYYSGTSTAYRSLDISHVMVVPGVYTGPYVDGDLPGAKWNGVPNNSASIGYPPSVA